MKLPIRCFKCTEDKGAQGHIALIEFRDDGRYEATCPHGHQTVLILQQSLFEILFEIGSYAIRDGYYREAVSSFTASLERFYEFFIRVVLCKQNSDQESFEIAWKTISRQSERQLGAFIFLYLAELGQSPLILTEAQIAFRNGVVHRGKIPTREQAISYGQQILDLLRPSVLILRSRFPEQSSAVIQSEMRKARDTGADNFGVGSISIPTIISLVDMGAVWESRPLSLAIEQLSDWDARIGSAN